MTDAVWDDAVEMGLRNQVFVELAHHHCSRMEFVQAGGRGLAEQATGLPINMRQVRCPVAHGGMAANLEFTVPSFYRENCVGCSLRAPTGNVPNLASFVEDEDAASAAARARESERLASEHQQWARRGEARRAMAARVNELMASVLRDLGILDQEPGAERDDAAERSALDRLRALAERTPELFTGDVIGHAVNMVAAGQITDLVLDPLRTVARRQSHCAPEVSRAAITVLQTLRSIPAGRCIADLVTEVDPDDLDAKALRSLVTLAGAPRGGGVFGRAEPNAPVGLVAVASLVPERLRRVLADMLPGPPLAPGLLLPPTARQQDPGTLYTVGSAAGAVRVLAGTHPDIAVSLVGPLVRQLSATLSDRHGQDGLGQVQRAVAVLLLLDMDAVTTALAAAGQSGSDELGERLVRVLDMARDLASAAPRWHEPGDPTPAPEQAATVSAALFETAMGRLGGDWGNQAVAAACDLIESLAEDDPQSLLPRLPALLGAALGLIQAPPGIATTRLEVVGGESPALRAMENETNRIIRSSGLSRLLVAVRHVAKADPVGVVEAIRDVLEEERDTERGSDATYALTGILGEIGYAHGEVPGVLRAVLPVLHTRLVAVDVGPRAQAVDAWVRIAARHALPSSLIDLLPALASDGYVAVARALLRAAVRLEWPPDTWPRLLLHATTCLKEWQDGSNNNGLKEATAAVLRITARMDNPVLLQAAETLALGAAESLGPFDLRDVLNRDWSPTSLRSEQMARLRLMQAVDPHINDRMNHREDDDQLEALLSCGPGLLSLSTAELTDAAADMGPDRPVAAAEFVEVMWRAARVDDTAALAQHLLSTTPDQPAYAVQTQFFTMLSAAARVDAEAATAGNWDGPAVQALAAADALAGTRDGGRIKSVIRSVRAAVGLRRVMLAAGPAGTTDPAAQLTQRAEELAAAGRTLSEASPYLTATGTYLRANAALCDVISHLLKAEASAYEADVRQVAAHGEAATRRSHLISAEVTADLGADDPAGAPLLVLLDAAASHQAGEPVAPLLQQWGSMPLPVPVVVGSRRRTAATSSSTRGGQAATVKTHPTVAVVLASLDGKLVTGPAVLRNGQVYELSVRVMVSDWPSWADRLEGELLTHLTPAELTTPTFTWSRADHAGDPETFEQAGSVALRFAVAAGSSTPPLLMRLTWRGHQDGHPESFSLDVAGHRELRLRPHDATRDRATNNAVFDERLLEMYDRLARAGYDETQLQAFCRLFTSMCRIGLAITWEKKYRRGTRVTERAFHDEVHNRLMADPELGGRVERGSPLALGYLDVRHDGITAELKVERQSPVTKARAPKYMGQPTQYAAADGARLSILTILDMSPKQTPIGTPENYLFELEPKLHGLDNPEAPSLVAVLVVNGNMPTPSSWSRRKAPVADQCP